MNHFSRAFWAAIILVFSHAAFSKVDPPNYDFSLDQMKIFMPGSPLKAATDALGAGDVLQQKGAYEIRRFYVAHIRYKFPVLVQTTEGAITDFYARLPAYFLHDIFHQSLINRIGKQDTYKKVEEQAVYIWKNKDNLTHVYSGTCTITCFPIFYSVYPQKHDYKGYTPIIKIMKEQELGLSKK